MQVVRKGFAHMDGQVLDCSLQCSLASCCSVGQCQALRMGSRGVTQKPSQSCLSNWAPFFTCGFDIPESSTHLLLFLSRKGGGVLGVEAISAVCTRAC